MTLSVVWQVLYGSWFVSEILVAVVTRTKNSSGRTRDRGSMLMLWIVNVAAITACIWISEATPANMFGGARWLKPVSVVVMLLALAIRWTAIFSLGKAFSANVAIRKSQQLNRTGMYRVVRHPSYLGLLLVFLAIGIHSRNWISLIIVTVPTTAVLLYRIRVEEIALNEAFGGEYAAYSHATKRLIPGLY